MPLIETQLIQTRNRVGDVCGDVLGYGWDALELGSRVTGYTAARAVRLASKTVATTARGLLGGPFSPHP